MVFCTFFVSFSQVLERMCGFSLQYSRAPIFFLSIERMKHGYISLCSFPQRYLHGQDIIFVSGWFYLIALYSIVNMWKDMGLLNLHIQILKWINSKTPEVDEVKAYSFSTQRYILTEITTRRVLNHIIYQSVTHLLYYPQEIFVLLNK